MGYSSWGWKESYTTERLAHTHNSTMIYEFCSHRQRKKVSSEKPNKAILLNNVGSLNVYFIRYNCYFETFSLHFSLNLIKKAGSILTLPF